MEEAFYISKVGGLPIVGIRGVSKINNNNSRTKDTICIRSNEAVAQLRLGDNVVMEVLECLNQPRVLRHTVGQHGPRDVVEFAKEYAS